jgi:hypothetical protein
MDMLYKKVGKKYKPVGHDWFGFPSTGVWLVTASTPPREIGGQHGWSGSCIMKLGELPALYPFARMAMSEEELAILLNMLGVKNLTNIDKAREILKWMSTKEGK